MAMNPSQLVNQFNSFKRLGSSYINYRLLVALCLFFLLLLIQDNIINLAKPTSIPYISIYATYIIVAIINFFTFRFYQEHIEFQLTAYLSIDIIVLSIFLFISATPSIAIIMLYMIVVFAASLLISPKKALTLTLLSIIAVAYQQFFSTVFNENKQTFLGLSSVITLIFMSTYALGQMTVKRLRFVEDIAVNQRKAILQLQKINQNIVEQIDTGFMVLDNQGQIITYNEAARELLSFPFYNNDIQQNIQTLQPVLQKQLHHHMQQFLRGTFIFQTDENSEKLSVQYRPISTQEQQLTLLILERLIKIDQQVQQLKLASLGQLSASIAHEIRNPLAAISQANELLMADGNDENTLLTEMIQKQCQRINRIIDDTLNMSRQNKTVPEQIVLFPWLNAFIKEDLSDIQRYLQLKIEDKAVILFDPHQLRLVLINLIRNAIRHGHQHQPESLVTVQAYFIDEMIFIDIIDQGEGVAPQQRQDLFEPFRSTATNGTGLGLYLSKTFCEANHARLKYIPQTQGACFRIECVVPENV